MPRFTPAEKERIRERLLGSGYDRFLAHGLEDTSIADLTADAGIATGTFYSFFDSKADLLAAVLRREAARIHDDLEATLDAHEDDPETAVRRFLERASAAIVENPLFRRTVTRSDRERLQAALSAEEFEDTKDRKLSLLVPYIEAWQERDLVVDGDPETIGAAVLYAAYLPLHRAEFGAEQYPRIRDLLFEWIATSVTT
ncbi:TetR family transcriptional regulator [Haloarcula rubripromontorii]|uniref:TetR family transcriptional regulator n=1 Tax=Haloarcula rubripromontorii TaxID=1705562 RepID=A0A847U0C2_9EURY|nr:TetR/AcrR family transcriptional regulator [Haloarcula rubripromontorii]NLV06206.1 TetR family transcriptional regulator [Haloarcula rubripromontorii]